MSLASVAPGLDLQPIELPAPPVPGSEQWRVHVYSHTHWDREWYRTYERFRMQLVGMVDRLLNELDANPRFTTFVLDGQTIVLEDYLAIRPEEEPRLRRLIGAGRLEVGPWHILPDEFLVSGESFVRNLLVGRRVASRFGDPLSVGYLPDPFGHVSQLPAILRGFGIDNVIFARGMTEEFDRLGNEFRWEAADGTDVLAIVQTSPLTNGYCNGEHLCRGYGPEDARPYEDMQVLLPALTSTARGDVLLIAAGCDHETVQEQLPDIVEGIGRLVPDADVRITGLASLVEDLRDAERRLEADGRSLERYRGELRGALHAPILASIFSARVPIKQDNDRLQALLEVHLEPLMATAVLAGVRPIRDVAPFLEHAWRLALENHPHDSIGGCSVDRVHEEMPARTLRAESVCRGLLEDLRLALGTGDRAVVHDGIGLGGIGERADGTPVALRAGTPGQLVELDGIVADEPVEVGEDEVRAGDRVARIAGSGDGRWLEVDGVRLDLIDEADAGDEYDFGAISGDEPIVATLERWNTRQAGPGVAELEVVHAFDLPDALARDRSARGSETSRHEVFTRVRVSRASALAQLVVEFDNRASDHRLRLRAVPLEPVAADATVEALGHFAIVERPARPAEPARRWKQDPPGLDHCLGAVRTGGTLLAGRGIHEYECRELAGGSHSLELTLLRSVGWLSRDDIHGRPGHAGPPLATPGAQCHGPHRVELAVGVGAAADFEQARAFLAPPLVLEPLGEEATRESGATSRARDIARITPEQPAARIAQLGLVVGGSQVVPSAVKLADDASGDLIVRWWAPVRASNPRARLELAAPGATVLRARLDESTLGPAPFQDGVVEVGMQPGAILTLRVALATA